MLDLFRPERRSTIVPTAAMLNRDGAVAALPPAGRFTLRLRPDDAAARPRVAGWTLDLPINACRLAHDHLSARLGPDEWLLIGPTPDDEAPMRAVAAALAGTVFALVDIGHRNVAFRVDGPHAAAIVNGGCPLDLDDAAFPAGSATRTVLGKAEILLFRPGVERSFRVECWRSFAPYVDGLLRELARDVAVTPDAGDRTRPPR